MAAEPRDPLTAGSREERDAILAERRRDAPVARVGSGAWFVASHAGVREGLLAVDHFVGAFGNTGALPEEETVLPGIPEPRHGKLRKLINSVLAYHHASQLEDFVRERAGEMVDALLQAGAGGRFVDFCAHVARPLPSSVIARALGVPAQDVPQFAVWSDEILQRITERGESRPLGELHPEFAGYVDEQVAQRNGQADAPDDLITRLLVTNVDGEHLTPRAVRTQILNLIIAGNETTRNLIGNLFWRLAQDPETWRSLARDPELRAVAIEETLRLDSPVQFLARTCTRSITIEGVPIAVGERVLFGVASANFDERVFDEATRFRLDRERPRDHAAFGAGPHICPGAFLARMEAALALDAALERIETFALDPDYRFDTNPVPFSYGPNTLSVRVQARAQAVGHQPGPARRQTRASIQ